MSKKLSILLLIHSNTSVLETSRDTLDTTMIWQSPDASEHDMLDYEFGSRAEMPGLVFVSDISCHTTHDWEGVPDAVYKGKMRYVSVETAAKLIGMSEKKLAARIEDAYPYLIDTGLTAMQTIQKEREHIEAQALEALDAPTMT